MATNVIRPIFEPSEATWRRLEELLSNIAHLSESSEDAETFFTILLSQLVDVLAASSGIVWLANATGKFQPAAAVNTRELSLDENSTTDLQHRALIATVARTGQAELFGPGVAAGERLDAINPTRWVILLQPLRSEGRCSGLIELFCTPDLSQTARQLLIEVLASVAELCADFDRRRRLHQLTGTRADWEKLDTLSRKVHRSLDLRETAFTLANDGRQFIGCDRVTVVVRRREQLQLLAISGVATPDRRSKVNRLIEKLATVVLAGGESLTYPSTSRQLPPQVKSVLHHYLDAAPARSIDVVPLVLPDETNSSRPFGALIVEQVETEFDEACRIRLEAVIPHAATALRNALHVAQIPGSRWLLNWWAPASLSSSRLRRAAFAAIAIVVVAIGLLPVDFTIESRGELQPAERREIFALNDGTVDEFLIGQHAAVQKCQPLFVLRNPQLELEFKRVFGEIETAGKRLAAVQAARSEGSTGQSATPVGSARLSGEETEVKAQLESLEQQLKLLKEQQAELTMRSPIDGQVLTWDVEQLLRDRPVQRGQALLTVANTSGAWKLELDLPDRRAGHLLQAQKAYGPDLNVSYVLITDPGQTYSDKISQVALSTEPTDTNNAAVRVTVDVQNGNIPQPRPGATVTAKIHCGRRALAYVWLHDLIDTIRTWIFF